MKHSLLLAVCFFLLIACGGNYTTSNTTDSFICIGGGMPMKINVQRQLPNEYAHAEWMKPYVNYIRDSIGSSEYNDCCIVCYLDDDEVPELCLMAGGATLETAIVLSQHCGVVKALYCGIMTEYIERSGFIMWRCGDLWRNQRYYVYKLSNGQFSPVIETEARCSYKGTNPYEQWDYFVYSISGQIVDTLHGKEADENSCGQIDKALDTAYFSKGESRKLLDSPQGRYIAKAIAGM